STTEDRTNYFETLPANRVNLGLWLEADRMRSLAVTQANLDNQREVVKEERRMRVDNSPYGTSIMAALYTAPYAASCSAYGHEVIGSMEDLNAAKLEDVQDFFATYYAPNNATMTVAGDFEPAQVKALVQQYFGSIPSHAAPAGVSCEKPFADLPRKLEIPDRNAKLPAVIMSYGAVAAGDADEPALSLLATILGQGESSRLNERLVKQERAALQAMTLFMARRGPGIFLAAAFANQGMEPARLQGLIEEEVAKVGKEGVTPAELEKAKAQYRANALDQLQTSMGKAEALNRAAVFRGDPALARTELARYAAVTQADIQRVASKYLVPANVAVIVARPESGKGVTP
ncbi:MAG TPA: pitrilysin family protein, partial [Longimicrobiales bacterium]